VIRAHKILLDTNEEHATYCAKAAGIARFSYNWGLNAWNQLYEIQKMDPEVQGTSEMELRRELNRIKKDEYPWMLEVTKCAPQMALKNLGKAFASFFKGQTKYPKFKIKGRDDRFTLSSDHVEVKENQIRLPHIGWIPMKEKLRFSGEVISVTISNIAGRWYASIAVEVTSLTLKPAKNHGKLGIDLGVNTLATLWKDDGTFKKENAARPLKTLLPQLRKLSKSLSRKVKDSNGWKNAKRKLGEMHLRIANIRKDRTHKLTTMISSTYSTVVIEDLDVKGMMKDPHRGFRRSLSDMAFGEFRRQIEYKMEARGGELIVADRYYPSSKTCSHCTMIFKELRREQKRWTCAVCKTTHDRDVNAAHNLWGLSA
jgi:putative transposase